LSLVHIRTLKMTDDVLSVRYSPNGKLLAVALLDSTVKVFYQDTLKFFLSLYGHKVNYLCIFGNVLVLTLPPHSSQYFLWTFHPILSSSSLVPLIKMSRFGVLTLAIVTSLYSRMKRVLCKWHLRKTRITFGVLVRIRC